MAGTSSGQVPLSLSVSLGRRTIVTESQPFPGRVIGLVENLKHTFPFLLQQHLWDLRFARLPWVFTRVIAVSEENDPLRSRGHFRHCLAFFLDLPPQGFRLESQVLR